MNSTRWTRRSSPFVPQLANGIQERYAIGIVPRRGLIFPNEPVLHVHARQLRSVSVDKMVEASEEGVLQRAREAIVRHVVEQTLDEVGRSSTGRELVVRIKSLANVLEDANHRLVPISRRLVLALRRFGLPAIEMAFDPG